MDLETSPSERMSWKPGWIQAVTEFTQELQATGYSPLTLRDYRGDVLRLGARLGLGPRELGPEHLPLARRLDEAEGLALAAVRRRAAAYRRFLEYLGRRGESGRLAPRLFAAIAAEPASTRVLFGLVFAAGLRLTEIASLEGRDLRVRESLVRCRPGCRLVPVHPTLARWLEELRQEVPRMPYRPILPGQQGFAANSRTLHARFTRVTGRWSELAHITPDRLRREAARELKGRGAPRSAIQAFLGQDRGRPVAPRRGRALDLGGLRMAIAAFDLGEGARGRGRGAPAASA